MTLLYHIKKAIYSIIFVSAPFIGINYYMDTPLGFILVMVSIIFFFINVVLWVNDTFTWNKGKCAICEQAWVPVESDAEGPHEYKCGCGRRIIL